MASPLPRTGFDFDRDALWMKRLARGLVGEHAADDVVQEAWLKVGDRGPVKGGYLAAVVRSLALRRLRGEKRRSVREAVSSRSEALPSTSEVAARLEITQRVSRAVDELAEPYRTTLVLRYFDGLSAAEIARRAGVPSATVRTRVKRGLEALRQRLDDDSGGRENWLPILLPLVRWDDEVAAASSAASIGLGVKIAIATLVVATGSIWAALSLAANEPDPPAIASFEPLDATPANRAVSRPTTSDRGPSDEARAALDAVERAGTSADSTTPDAGLTLLARAVDEANRPLPNAWLRLTLDPTAVAHADAGGWLELACPEDHPVLGREDPIEVRVGAPGRRTRYVERRERAGTLQLGEIRLDPGGTVFGRIVDASGLGVEDALVVASRPIGPESAVEAHANARQGPLELRARSSHTIETRPVVGRSGPGGAFRLDGLPTGHGTVWARSETSLWTHGEPLVIDAGMPAESPDLVLTESVEDVIAGRVTDPDGRPLPGVEVYIARRSGGGSVQTDRNGAFHFLAFERAPYEIHVASPSWEWENAELSDVAPGTLDLDIALVRSTWFWLDVRDEQGAFVRSGGVRLVPATGRTDRALARSGADLDEDGEPRRMRRPAEPFRVLVEAPGFQNALVGPFDPERVPDPLAITLVPLAGITGRVLRPDGSPAAGASVRLHRAPTERTPGLTHAGWNGDREPFVYELFVHPTARVFADADGNYRLPLPDADATADGELEEVHGRRGPDLRRPRHTAAGGRRWFVHAELPGAAGLTSGPHRFESTEELELDLQLPPSGAIDGTLALEDAGSPLGWTLVAVDGLAGFAEATVDADGRFRFEHLHAGGWQVRAFEPGSHYRADAHQRAERAPEPDVVVTAGETVTYRHASHRGATARLVGEVRVDGVPPGGWLVAVQARDGTSLRSHEATLDAEGRFELMLKPARKVSIRVRSGGQPSLSLRGSTALVAGHNEWSAHLETARLRGQVDPELVPAAPFSTLSYAAEQGSLRALAQFEPDADGAFGWIVVPAGRGSLTGQGKGGYFSTEQYGEIELAPGEERAVDLR